MRQAVGKCLFQLRPTLPYLALAQARSAELEAERDALAAAAGVTPERCRAAKAQLYEAAKLCAPGACDATAAVVARNAF